MSMCYMPLIFPFARKRLENEQSTYYYCVPSNVPSNDVISSSFHNKTGLRYTYKVITSHVIGKYV